MLNIRGTLDHLLSVDRRSDVHIRAIYINQIINSLDRLRLRKIPPDIFFQYCRYVVYRFLSLNIDIVKYRMRKVGHSTTDSEDPAHPVHRKLIKNLYSPICTRVCICIFFVETV